MAKKKPRNRKKRRITYSTRAYYTRARRDREEVEAISIWGDLSSLGKARVCKSSKAGKSFSVRCRSDKSSSISPCRHPLGLVELSFVFLLAPFLVPPWPLPVSPCPSLLHPLRLSRDGRRRLKLTRVVSVLAYSVCSSPRSLRHTCALPSRTHTHVPRARDASVRACSRRSVFVIGAVGRLLSHSLRIQCVRVKNTRYWSRVDARKRQEIRETGPRFCKLLSSPCSSRERKRMWRYSSRVPPGITVYLIHADDFENRKYFARFDHRSTISSLPSKISFGDALLARGQRILSDVKEPLTSQAG